MSGASAGHALTTNDLWCSHGVSVNDLYDVSVLFTTPAAARAAWHAMTGSNSPTATMLDGELVGLAGLVDHAMPTGELDLRLVGRDSFDPGAAYVWMKLGMTNLLALRLDRTQPVTLESPWPSPWDELGRIRGASRRVSLLLEHGGHAVVLHQAATAVKTAHQFAAELRSPDDPGLAPYLAWLDTLATIEDGAQSRTFGMPSYFASPNVRAITAGTDTYSIERTMQAVKYTAGLIAAGGANPFTLRRVAVPLWYSAGPRAPALPADGEECTEWSATWDADDPAMITLRSKDLVAHHPARLWAAAADSSPMPFEIYTRGVCELITAQIQPMMRIDQPRFDAAGQPPLRVLIYEAPGIVCYATAGFGRIRSTGGTPEFATEHAELCLFAPRLDARLERVLLGTASFALTTRTPGGMKDWDGLPPGADGWGHLVVPLDDLTLAPERPIALRVLVPVTADEHAMLRTTPDRAAWFRSTIGTRNAIAARWSQVLGR